MSIPAIKTLTKLSFLCFFASAALAQNNNVYFSYQIGGSVPSAEQYSITTQFAPLNLSVSTTGQPWLLASLSSTVTPSVVNISVNPVGLQAGTYTGTVNVAASGSNTLTFTVSLTVTAAPPPVGQLVVTPTSLTFSTTTNGTLFPQSLTVNSSGGVIAYQASTNAQWLTVIGNGNPTSNGWGGTTPGSVSVFASSSGLAAGTYSAGITLTSSQASDSPLTIPVTLVVSAAALHALPPNLSFVFQQGTPLPASQSISITSNEALDSFTASTSTPWISFSPTTAAFMPTTLTVSVNPSGMAIGAYNGQITLTGTYSTLIIPVGLIVQSAPTVTASPTQLTFAYQVGGATPTTQSVAVTGSASGTAFTAQAATNTGGSWLSVFPTTGTTPTTLTVSTTPTTVLPGSYQGTVSVSGANGATGLSLISVTLTVTAQLPTITSVLNAASFMGQGISPGEIVSIFGSSIGPVTALQTQLVSGKVSTSVGGVQVMIGGTPAPLTYVSATQINCVVPYETVIVRYPTVQVQYLGQTSNTLTLNLVGSLPGIFATNGSGQGAILNQNGSFNGSSNPETVGNIITVYMTGEGQTAPPGVTGSVTCENGCATAQQIPVPTQLVTALVNNQPATILFYGEAPGLVAGVLQVNLIIPIGTQSGTATLVIAVNGINSQSGVTFAVR